MYLFDNLTEAAAMVNTVGNWVIAILCKYWMLATLVVLVVLSASEPQVYRIFYMVFVIILLAVFTVCSNLMLIFSLFITNIQYCTRTIYNTVYIPHMYRVF